MAGGDGRPRNVAVTLGPTLETRYDNRYAEPSHYADVNGDGRFSIRLRVIVDEAPCIFEVGSRPQPSSPRSSLAHRAIRPSGVRLPAAKHPP